MHPCCNFTISGLRRILCVLTYSSSGVLSLTGRFESAITTGAAKQHTIISNTGSTLPHAKYATAPSTAANTSESHEYLSISFTVNFSLVLGVTVNTAFLFYSPAITVRIIMGASDAYVATFTRK